MKKKNIILICFLIILSLFIVYITILINNERKDINKDEYVLKDKYVLGNKIILKELSNMIDINNNPIDNSKWIVLYDKSGYLTLISQKPIAKLNPSDATNKEYLNQLKKELQNKNIVFDNNSTVRSLNEIDLTLLGCNVKTTKCTNIPKSLLRSNFTESITRVTYKKDYLLITKKGIKIIPKSDNDSTLAYFHPVIVIPKTNLS